MGLIRDRLYKSMQIIYAWPCSWSTGLVLFYLNRYLPFIELILVGRRTWFIEMIALKATTQSTKMFTGLVSPTISQGVSVYEYYLSDIVLSNRVGMLMDLSSYHLYVFSGGNNTVAN